MNKSGENSRSTTRIGYAAARTTGALDLNRPNRVAQPGAVGRNNRPWSRGPLVARRSIHIDRQQIIRRWAAYASTRTAKLSPKLSGPRWMIPP